MKFSTWLNALTADATPAGDADYVVIYDASAGDSKKVLLDNLPGSSGSVGSFTNYSETSTVVGWSSFTLKKIYYIKIEHLVFVWFQLAGTSNSTAVNFTLPHSAEDAIGLRMATAGGTDNGTVLTGVQRMTIETTDTSKLNVYKDGAAAAWTASGTKGANGQFFYAADLSE